MSYQFSWIDHSTKSADRLEAQHICQFLEVATVLLMS